MLEFCLFLSFPQLYPCIEDFEMCAVLILQFNSMNQKKHKQNPFRHPLVSDCNWKAALPYCSSLLLALYWIMWTCYHQVHACRTIVLFLTRRLWPPARWRQRSLVWLPSVGTASHVENDAQHWWWVLSTVKPGTFKGIAFPFWEVQSFIFMPGVEEE